MGKWDLIAKAASAVAKEAGLTDSVDTMINSALQKADKLCGYESTADIIRKGSCAHYLIIRSRSVSASSLVSIASASFYDKDITKAIGSDYDLKYQVVTANNEIKYCVVTKAVGFFTDAEDMALVDAYGTAIGRVKLHAFTTPGLLNLEHDSKKCTVTIGDDICISVRGATSFKERSYEVDIENLHIKNEESGSFKIFTVEQAGGFFKKEVTRDIATIYRAPLQLINGFSDSLILGYNDIKDELLTLAIALGIEVTTSGVSMSHSLE